MSLEENVGINNDLGLDKGFLTTTPKTQQQRKKQINWTLSKLKVLMLQIMP